MLYTYFTSSSSLFIVFVHQIAVDLLSAVGECYSIWPLSYRCSFLCWNSTAFSSSSNSFWGVSGLILTKHQSIFICSYWKLSCDMPFEWLSDSVQIKRGISWALCLSGMVFSMYQVVHTAKKYPAIPMSAVQTTLYIVKKTLIPERNLLLTG